MNKYYKKLILPFFFIVIFATKAYSSHIVGGIITYTYLGSSNYSVTLKLYRDCSGIAFPASAAISVYQANGQLFTVDRSFTFNLGTVTNIPMVLPPCATAPNPTPCVQEGIFTGTVNLPASPGGMHLVYSLCCRNAAVGNIATPGTIGETFYAYIPCYNKIWTEDFNLPNGTTVDNGATSWSLTNDPTPPTSAQVNAGQYQVVGSNNGGVNWVSQVINISTYTAGVNLSANLDKAGSNWTNSDTLKIYYSLNGGPKTLFPVNGQNVNNWAAPRFATATGLVGNTIQIFIRSKFNANNNSTGKTFYADMVTVYNNNFLVNNSANYNNLPPLLFCSTNSFTLNQGASDADGDSLVYSMYTPYSDAAPTFPDNIFTPTPVTWLAGYSATSPFNAGGPGVTINPNTGVITGVANTNGRYVFGVMCSEYRNGVLLDQVVRDYQVVSVTCPPFVPPAPTLTANTPLCVGQTLSMTATSSVAATYNWTGPNGFTYTGTSATIANVTILAAGVYSVTGTVSGCTGPASTIAIVVNTVPATPTVTANTPLCTGQNLTFTSTVQGGASFGWTGPNGFTSALQNPTISGITLAGAGTYSLTQTVSGCTSPPGTLNVVVNALPTAPGLGANTPLCAGQTLSLTSTFTAGASYNWTGPNSFTSAVQNPTIGNITLAGSGVYSVAATISGCTGPAGTVSVTVNTTPAAPTVSANTPLCTGQTLSLTSTFTAGASYSWSGPNGFTSAVQNPTIGSITVAGSGVYSVNATIGSCTGPGSTITVIVNPTPAAPTASANTPLCTGQTLSLTSTFTAGAGYNWTGPNSFTSAVQNPTIGGATPAATGVYSVAATINGCTGPSGTVSVNVTNQPIAPTAGANTPLCVGQTLSLTASFTAGLNYTWSGPNSFTSAVQNPTIGGISLAGAGTYSVFATTAGGCSGPVGVISVSINPTPAAPTTGANTPLCTGQTLSLTSTFTAGASYNWTGPNSFTSAVQNPTIGSITLAGSGIYSVNATISGCSGPAGTVSVTVNPTPAAPTAANNSSLCAGQTLNLTGLPNGANSYSWTGPNAFTSVLQNPTIAGVTVLASGTYSLTQTVNGCTSPAGVTNVTINPIPAAPTAANNSSLCAGQTLNLTGLPNGANSYSWTGPNAFTSVLQNPTIAGVTVLASGTYSLTQTVNGCTSPSGVTNVTINPIPAAPTAANNSSLCAGQTLNLTGLPNGANSYSWTGPNAFTSVLQNPTIAGVTVLASGTYSLTQTVNGCTSPAGVTNVTINPIPAAPTAANNSSLCAGQTLNLTGLPNGANSYSWTGPNAFTSVLQNPTIAGVTVLASGTYSLTQTVNGCTSPAGVTNVTINPIPAAPTAANNSSLCAGQTLSLTANPGGAASYSWTGPNSFTSSVQNPTIGATTTSASGTYSVTQVVLGCASPAGVTSVTINPIPAAPTAANNSSICAGQTLSLTANPGGAASYDWSGPNSFTSSVQNPTIGATTISASGTYSVTQTVAGCTSSAGVTNVTVVPIPAAPTAANNSSLCAGQTLSLTANPGGAASYSWTGPNSFTSSVQNPTIGASTTSASGTYSVTQTVLGCTSPAGITNVTINPTPAAPTAANNSSMCAGQTLSLTANPGGAASYNWTGPNSFTSSVQNPTIGATTTSASGTYSVTQTVAGCTSSAGITNVTINPIPAAPTAASNSTICAGLTLSLTALPNGADSYNWSGPNSFTSSVQNPTIGAATTSASGTYSLTQTVLGCTSPVTTLSVTVSPIPAAPMAASNSSLCAGQTLSLTATFSAGATYSWTGPNTFTSNVQNPVIVGAGTISAGQYSVSMVVAGCAGPIGMVNVTINPTPAAPTAANNSSLCAGQTLSLTANPGGADSYSWTGPNTFTSSVQNPTIGATTTSASGTYSVTQTVLGCTSPAAITNVTINPIPAAPTAANNSSLCAGQTLSLTANPGGADSYSWTGPNTFTDSAQNPTIAAATTSASGTYSVTQTILGCTSPVAITNVTINPIPAVPTAANNSSICAGQNLSLTALPNGADSYDWTGPNTFTSNTQNPVIVGTTTLASGDYTVTQTVLGCTSPIAITSVTVNPIPNPPIGNSNSPVCGGGALIFTLTPPGGIYSWTGPNSFTSNIQSPTISPAPFSATGDYSVTVTLLGCTSSVAIIGASVGAIPNPPDISATSPLCAGSSLSLSATFTNGVAYTWSGPNSFTSNVQNPVITPAGTLAAGVYTAFGDINGCVGPVSTVAVVVDTPAIVNAGPRQDTVCYSAIFIPLTGSVTGGGSTGGNWTTLGSGAFSPSNSLVTTYSMSPADQNSPSFQLVLTSVGGGCPAQSDTIRFIVLGQPTVNVGTNLNVCKNAFVPLSGTITGVTNTGTWTSTGTGTFTPNISTLNGYYIPSSADTSSGMIKFVLESTNNHGCASNRDSLFVTFIPSPVANFTNTNACANKALNFTDLSAPSPSISSWAWDFGDGSGTSTSANPIYSYAASNVYTVTQIITLQNGCSDTIKKPITVYNSPVANFSVSPVCQGDPSSFFDASTITPDTLASWHWNFGDGNSSNIANPQNTYSSTGVYNVNFTVTTNKGCSDMTVKTVTVHARPHADFAISSATVLAYENVSFTDQSSPAPMASWNWNFGNATSTLQNPNNSFPDKGVYTVTLSVIDNNGCADTAKKDVLVYLLPMVPTAFTPNHDGHNDVLFVKGGPFVSMYLRVYNNWGELIFESRDQEVGWDGTFKGEPVPLGVYVYILDVNLYNGTSVRKTGDVTVLK